jgi:hypothetical protein
MAISKEWIRKFLDQIDDELCSKLAAMEDRFSSCNTLLGQFRRQSQKLLKIEKFDFADPAQQKSFKQLIEKHNELCVAYEILYQKAGSTIERLEYEPNNPYTKRKIDFHAISSTKEEFWIEVKTIHPIVLSEGTKSDKWVDYLSKKQDKNKYFPENTELILSRESGGEIWHDYKAARTQMLEYVRNFEDRIEESHIREDNICILAFVGNGYHWRLDHLEDFVAFYHGHPRSDDVFLEMQKFYIADNGINLSKRINMFAYFEHRESSVFHDSVDWNV